MSYKYRTNPITISDLGVVEVVGSNPAGPISKDPANTLVFAGSFVFLGHHPNHQKSQELSRFAEFGLGFVQPIA